MEKFDAFLEHGRLKVPNHVDWGVLELLVVHAQVAQLYY